MIPMLIPLEYSFSEPFDSGGIWKPGYNNQGEVLSRHLRSAMGNLLSLWRMEVDITINTNRTPVIAETFSNATLS